MHFDDASRLADDRPASRACVSRCLSREYLASTVEPARERRLPAAVVIRIICTRCLLATRRARVGHAPGAACFSLDPSVSSPVDWKRIVDQPPQRAETAMVVSLAHRAEQLNTRNGGAQRVRRMFGDRFDLDEKNGALFARVQTLNIDPHQTGYARQHEMVPRRENLALKCVGRSVAVARDWVDSAPGQSISANAQIRASNAAL